MNAKTIDGGSAFPGKVCIGHTGVNETPMYEHPSGMSLRDYFAAKAMQGFCANPAVFAANGMNGWSLVNCKEHELADYCHFLADAMLKARSV